MDMDMGFTFLLLLSYADAILEHFYDSDERNKKKILLATIPLIILACIFCILL